MIGGSIIVGTLVVAGTVALTSHYGAEMGDVYCGPANGPACDELMMQDAIRRAKETTKETESDSRRDRREDNYRFALGLQEYIFPFAKQHNAQTFMFDPLNAWKINFQRWLADSRSEFYVNLTGMDERGGPEAAVQRAINGSGSATDWELLKLVDHADHEADAGRDFWKGYTFSTRMCR